MLFRIVLVVVLCLVIQLFLHLFFFFFFKQKTAYEMRISDWSSDVCSSDLSLPSASCANTLSMPAFLLPSRNSTVRYCSDWKPDDGQIGRASCRERVCQYV